MLVSRFEHEGQTYVFEPPIDTGNHQPETLPQLVALAIKGHDAPDIQLDMGRLLVRLGILHTESDVATMLNVLMEGKHSATVQ